jgi:hypothetical protein
MAGPPQGALFGNVQGYHFTIEACSNLVSYFLIHDALRAMTGFAISFAFLCFRCRRSVRDYFFRPGLTLKNKE